MPVFYSISRRAPSTIAAAALALAACLLVLLTAPVAEAAVSGFVRDADTSMPLAGASVHLQADTSTVVVSAADGSFDLPVTFAGFAVITAALTYDAGASTNYNTGAAFAMDGTSGIEILLQSIPSADNPSYSPPEAGLCGSCHGDQFSQWQTANHSLAGTDEWVLDLFSGTGTAGGSAGYVFTDLHDPGETGFCATCHAPMEDVFDPGNVMLDEVSTLGGLDGVSCLACHQMDSVNDNVDALHHLGNSTYRFPDERPFFDTWQFVWGPLDDVSFGGMRAAYAPHFRESRMCASCHQYVNPDTGAPGQNTYGEWLASPFSVPGPTFQSCQDCHMPPADTDGTVCVLGDSPTRPAQQRRQHTFIGATPTTLADAILLDASALDGAGLLQVTAAVTNEGAGHAFPSGVSIRNALLVIEASYDGTPLNQVSGPVVPFWADDEVPGQQPGDYADYPGKGFAKILEGRINGTGPTVRPVLFIDAEGVFSDTLIPSGATDVTTVEFQLPPEAEPGDLVDVTVRLLYRRAFRALAVTKGWDQTPQGGPVEIEVARQDLSLPLTGGPLPPAEIPTAGSIGLLLLALLLAAGALLRLRRAA
ncbi:MAG: multiheme c-type cytochrome [Acidobacteriota bacterium]|nr:multiheme c-type cytochrome [Acidobacteriota bacterium]